MEQKTPQRCVRCHNDEQTGENGDATADLDQKAAQFVLGSHVYKRIGRDFVGAQERLGFPVAALGF